MSKKTCGECEFYGKKDLCPWPKDTPWPRRADEKQCRAYWLLVKTRLERDEARAKAEEDLGVLYINLRKAERERDELRADIRDLHENNLIVYGPGEANRGWWKREGFLNDLEKRDIRMRLGEPGLRDPSAPCYLYRHGEPLKNADCEGDGHYLCCQCCSMAEEKRGEG